MRWFVSKGWHGWVLLLVLVVAFDVLAIRYGGESMTDTARRWFHHGFGRVLVLGLIVFLALHLTVLPARYDPLFKAYRWIERRYGPHTHFVNPVHDDTPGGLD